METFTKLYIGCPLYKLNEGNVVPEIEKYRVVSLEVQESSCKRLKPVDVGVSRLDLDDIFKNGPQYSVKTIRIDLGKINGNTLFIEREEEYRKFSKYYINKEECKKAKLKICQERKALLSDGIEED